MKKEYQLNFLSVLILMALLGCQDRGVEQQIESSNPLLRESNEIIAFDELTPENILGASSTAIAEANETLASIVKVSDRDFENTLRQYDRMYNSIARIILPLDLSIETDPREEIREAGKKAQAELKDFMYSLDLNEELYNAIKEYSTTEEAQTLEGPKKRFLNTLLLNYKRAGFELEAEQRQQVKDYKSVIDRLGNEYRGNVAAASSDFIEISESETGGLDSAYLTARKTTNGTYKIDVSYPSLIPFLKYSTSDSSRRELEKVYHRRAAPENVAILDSILYLRHQLAQLLGYPTYAAYEFENKMAINTQTVWDFENSLMENVKKKADYDYNLLLKTKSEYTNEPATVLEMWETSFYTQILMQSAYALDEREVKQYFELNAVLNGLFQITQQVLGLKYEEIDSPKVWHPDVRMFKCIDATSDKLIGRFYLDLYPRENKYSHAAMFTITGGMALENGGYEMPEAALVCNFPKPQGDEPSLMFHGDVETFFHEFGHLLHCLVTKAELAYQSGPENVVLDFVEAPSQIYENWAWNKKTLALFAKHYETGEIIPDELLDKMLAAKNLNSGMAALRQLFYGTYALTVHDRYIPYGEENTTQIGYALRKKITRMEYLDGDQFQAAFGHLIGYTAGYYSYMWSKVYAQDMWSVFEEKGALNPEVGMAYRQKVLEPEGSKPAIDLVRDFLGREPNNKAMLKDLGLEID